jgi:hypothetical protein
MDKDDNKTNIHFDNATNTMPSLSSIHVVEFYLFPFIFTIGTVCNILTFIVMRRKRMRHQSTYFYMAVLAIADELVLICGCLNFWVYIYTTKTLLIVSALLCKIISVGLYATFHFSVWMVVTMTIERFIAVSYPLQASSWCTVKRAKIATIIIAFLILCINFHFLFTHTLVKVSEVPIGCKPIQPFEAFVEKIWPWIDASVYSVVPFSLLIVFNILIVHNLIKATKKIDKINKSNLKSQKNRSRDEKKSKTSCVHCCQKRRFLAIFLNKHSASQKKRYETMSDRKNLPNAKVKLYQSSDSIKSSKANYIVNPNKEKRAGHLNSGNGQSSSTNSNRRLTIMLLVISITFITTSLPIVTLQNVEQHFKLNSSHELNMLRGVFLVLQYLNHSMNFFLYAVTGKSFRKEFYSLFDVCKKNKNSGNQPKILNSHTFSTTCNNINKNLVASKKDLNLEIGSSPAKNLYLITNKNNCTPKIFISSTSDNLYGENNQPSLKNVTDDEKNEGIFSKKQNETSSLRAEISILEDHSQIFNEDKYETNF